MAIFLLILAIFCRWGYEKCHFSFFFRSFTLKCRGMFLSTHAAAGILISQNVNNPWAVFGLAIASHLALDFIPHGDEGFYHDHEWKDEKRYRRVVGLSLADLGILMFLLFWAFQYLQPAKPELLLIGVIGAIVPDIFEFFFPVIHERFSWLFLVRWLYQLTKPTGLRYVVRAQNWIHNVLRNKVVQRDIPFRYGLSLQVVLAISLLAFSR
jgi:hypothetical protein